MDHQEEAHPAAVAQEFMKRADMKGGEVQAYAQTFNWLQEFLEGEIVTISVEELKDLREAAVEPSEMIPVLEPEVTDEELEAVDSETSE